MVKANKVRKSTAKARTPARVGDPTPERQAKGDIVERQVYDDGRLQLARRSEDPIERLLRGGSISARQAEAALKLRRDYDIGVNQARDHDGGGSGHGHGPTEVSVIAITEFKRAMRALRLACRGVVMAVACQDMSVRDYAARLRLNERLLMPQLDMGLTDLADHYGLKSDIGRTSVQCGEGIGRLELQWKQLKGGRRVAISLGGHPVNLEAFDDETLVKSARAYAREHMLFDIAS